MKPSRYSGRMHDGFRREALSVLRQDVRAGQKSRGAPEDVFGGVPEDVRSPFVAGS